VGPAEFAEVVDQVVAAGLVKRTRLLGQDNLALTKKGRAALAVADLYPARDPGIPPPEGPPV